MKYLIYKLSKTKKKKKTVCDSKQHVNKQELVQSKFQPGQVKLVNKGRKEEKNCNKWLE